MTERSVPLVLIWGKDHYERVVRAIREAKVSVWIATANLKDVHVEAPVGTRARARGRFASLFDELGELAARGVDVRVLHAGPPSRALSARLKGATAAKRVQLAQCIRNHMKMIAIDGRLLYLGSANFTGAGIGAKGEERRNFEAGILTSDDVLLDRMQGELDAIWEGRRCKACKLRSECPRPLDMPRRAVSGERGSSRSGSASRGGAAAASPPPGAAPGRRRRT